MNTLDIQQIRKDFPSLSQKIYGDKNLIYLDNAATAQKPLQVIQAMDEAALYRNANIHRGVHFLSREATEAHERARKTVAKFIGAESSDEVLFTRGTTESINLVAHSYGRKFLKPGDEVIVSVMEHHSNIVPWQLLEGIKVVPVPVTETGDLDMEAYRKAFTPRTRFVSMCHSSNVLGTTNPIREIAQIAHEHGVHILVDAAQSVAHRPIDVQELGVDFLAFSGHKLYAPTGIGVLYGRRELLEAIPPYQGGGEMIHKVTFEKTTFNEIPFKFEAGTPDFIGSVGLAKAIEYISALGFESIMKYEEELLTYATERLLTLDGIKIHGTSKTKEAVISFTFEGLHPYDVGMLIDRMGIAVRTGHHCAQPLMHELGLDGTIRASFAFYNTKEDIDALIVALQRVLPMLR
ncbi:aminotransferase class V-fold PLP-dependent enzyme [Porphyromonas cangingivalis]|uniref:Cysteine desulfurase n=1 Tax=Porphyromonas cangingivalis TaxID=36874 RepID=A0A1T4JMS9_PORCN|nr:cysteine desulfurase [Porphyromonas cangingivalis]SJZ31463.1 cysteine desulfurase / selenocysteine lyase [Porphyromonas cangingivalis]VEJ04425.1 Probable cysteine desulfurase [Porphyromonas cangingivalis]